MDGDKRGWRLFRDLNNAFKRDPSIDEFDYIPVLEPRNNKSPIVLVDHKLGLELWCVKILFGYAYQTLFEWRSKKAPKFIEHHELSALTRAVVLVNPECYTAWNIRKELIESGELTIADDLKLNALVLTKHPKSSETFLHRRWVLSRYVDNHLQSSQGSTCSTGSAKDGFVCMEGIDLNVDLTQNQHPVQNGDDSVQIGLDYHKQMKTELSVCTCAADRYPCNYYAWSQRIWIIQHCYNCSIQVLLSELQSSQQWVEKHISDTCGYHYRQFLLTTLASQKDQVWQQFSIQYTTLLEKEHSFMLDLIDTFPGHETMWNHRKFVFRSIYDLYDNKHEKSSVDNECNSKKTKFDVDHHTWAQNELESVEKIQLKSSNAHQRKLCENFVNWLKRTVNCD